MWADEADFDLHSFWCRDRPANLCKRVGLTGVHSPNISIFDGGGPKLSQDRLQGGESIFDPVYRHVCGPASVRLGRVIASNMKLLATCRKCVAERESLGVLC